MISLASILVDIDAVAAGHPALDQAVNFAARCGARVKIVDVLPSALDGAAGAPIFACGESWHLSPIAVRPTR